MNPEAEERDRYVYSPESRLPPVSWRLRVTRGEVVKSQELTLFYPLRSAALVSLAATPLRIRLICVVLDPLARLRKRIAVHI